MKIVVEVTDWRDVPVEDNICDKRSNRRRILNAVIEAMTRAADDVEESEDVVIDVSATIEDTDL